MRQRVQAQTLANLYLAIEQGLEIVPVVNKIDLPNAEVEKAKKEIIHLIGCPETDILLASGKTGLGVREVLERVIERVPAPVGDIDQPLRALILIRYMTPTKASSRSSASSTDGEA